MGTVFSIDIRDPGDWRQALAEVVGWLHHVDAVFSTYRVDSAVSRLRSGDLDRSGVSDEVETVLRLCVELKLRTEGFFDAEFDGRFDPTGVVKGWAVERASAILLEHGGANHAVNGGGDIMLAGSAAPGHPWRIGVSDPLDRAKVLTVVGGTDLAIATSGTGERGHHIVDPTSGSAAEGLASVTITGPSLAYADAYATAAFAMGDAARGWLIGVDGYEGLIVAVDGRHTRTPGFALPHSGALAGFAATTVATAGDEGGHQQQ